MSQVSLNAFKSNGSQNLGDYEVVIDPVTGEQTGVRKVPALTKAHRKVVAFITERPLLIVAIITALVGIWMLYDWNKRH